MLMLEQLWRPVPHGGTFSHPCTEVRDGLKDWRDRPWCAGTRLPTCCPQKVRGMMRGKSVMLNMAVLAPSPLPRELPVTTTCDCVVISTTQSTSLTGRSTPLLDAELGVGSEGRAATLTAWLELLLLPYATQQSNMQVVSVLLQCLQLPDQ